MYYPMVGQPASAGMWPNVYQVNTQPQQAIPTVYYQVPSVPTATTVPEVFVQQQPPIYYQTSPQVIAPPVPTTTTTEVQQPVNTTTTSKTVTTRILDPTTIPTIPPAPVTTTTTAVETIKSPEKPYNNLRGLRSLSASTYSDDTTTSISTTVTPPPRPVVPPPLVPIQTTTTTVAPPPVRRVVHQPYRQYTPTITTTAASYYSSDLDYGKRKVYKTDYKYRHYYCCNLCKGRCDLRNRSYSCCEWFYGCPLWGLILCSLLFLALLVTFITLFALLPAINSSRRSATAETRLLNRTKIVYGFYQNCGYQVNVSSNTPTTLILCTNTATTTTAPIQLSPYYTIINQTNTYSSCKLLILFCYLLLILKIN